MLKQERAWFVRMAALSLGACVAVDVHAQSAALKAAQDNVSAVGTKLGGKLQGLPSLLAGLVNAVLGAMGIVFVILIVYAGILYMQGGGDKEKTTKAKNLIVNSVIGLVIIIAAYAIASFIILQLQTASTGK